MQGAGPRPRPHTVNPWLVSLSGSYFAPSETYLLPQLPKYADIPAVVTPLHKKCSFINQQPSVFTILPPFPRKSIYGYNPSNSATLGSLASGREGGGSKSRSAYR